MIYQQADFLGEAFVVLLIRDVSTINQ